jgi:hypothetical protein
MATKKLGELKDIAGKGFDPVPATTYSCEVVGATFVHNPGKNPFIKLTFAIVEGPYTKRLLWDNAVLGESEGSAGVFFSKMKALQVPEDFWAPYADGSLEDAAPDLCVLLMGRPVNVVTTVKEYPEHSGIFKNKTVSLKVATSAVPKGLPAQQTPSPSSGSGQFTTAAGGPVLPAGL